MARGSSSAGGGAGRIGKISRIAPAAKRAWPVVLMAWDRWQSLSDEDKARYKRQAREAADRGRVAMERSRRRRGGA